METEDLLRVRLDGRAPSLRSVRVGIGEEIDGVVAKALARDPQHRYASAGAFASDLLAASQHDDATGVLAPPPRPLKATARRGLQIDATTLALLAIIVVLVATLGIFASFQGRTPEVLPPASPGATAAAAGAPNVVGSKLSEATAALLAAGFRRVSWDVDVTQRGAACAVVRQQPAAGAAFRRGDEAQVWYVPGNNCTKKDEKDND